MADEATMHNQAAYDQIAGLYAARHTERDRSFPGLAAAFAARLPSVADIADLGCGPASDGARFARAGHRVTGIDRSAGMLAHAARALPGRVVRADLRRLPVAGQGVRLEQVPYAQDTQRWFFYRDPAELDEQVRGAGLQVVAVTEEITHRHWLKILARAA